MLERLGRLRIEQEWRNAGGDRGGMSQAELDQFCRGMDSLKLLEIALPRSDKIGTLILRGIDSLEHLRICELDGGDRKYTFLTCFILRHCPNIRFRRCFIAPEPPGEYKYRVPVCPYLNHPDSSPSHRSGTSPRYAHSPSPTAARTWSPYYPHSPASPHSSDASPSVVVTRMKAIYSPMLR